MPVFTVRDMTFRMRWALLFLACWLVAAGAGTLAIPPLERVVESHARSFMPAAAASSIEAERAAAHRGETAGDNLNYIVLERNSPLTQLDRRYYDDVVNRLRVDKTHVDGVTDLWSDPVTAEAAVSKDRKAAYVMIRLSGRLGTAQAGASVAALRQTVDDVGPPPGLAVYVTGPGATIADEFEAIDQQMLAITGVTVAVILLLLLLVYRSPVTAAIPLLSVGLALAVARSVVAALGEAGHIEVSLFSVALLAAMLLGAGTDYGIFLIGRYHEGRRHGLDPETAFKAAYSAVAPVIIGSGLTIAAALATLGLAQVGFLRSAGTPCAIGILVAMLGALTLTPALLRVAIRFGFAEPRAGAGIARRWRRIGVAVARWPGPILVVAVGFVLLTALPLLGMRIGWDEPGATPDDTESNRGYAAADRHFPANRLLPAVLTVVADHDLRNPAGLIAVERISSALMEIPGVRMVQSASRPAGRIPDQATVTYQGGVIGRSLGDSADRLSTQLQRISALDSSLVGMQNAVAQMSRGLAAGARGFDEIGSAATDMKSGMTTMQQQVGTVSGYLDPLRQFVGSQPDCAANLLCDAVEKVVTPVDALVSSTTQMAQGADKLTAGSGAANVAFTDLPDAVSQMSAALTQARSATADLGTIADSMGPQLRELSDYLAELDAEFAGSGAAGFYLPRRALQDPRFVTAMRSLLSADGRAATLLVYGDGVEWSATGAHRARQIQSAVREATKEGTLTPVEIDLAGVGPATRDLQDLLAQDMRLLIGATLLLIFAIVGAMLRSPVAALVVVGTVVVSYASALGASVAIWQYLLGQDLHWAVPANSFIALVAVGADYNLLLAMRIREERSRAGAGIGTAVIRAFAGTGGVVTTAGIVFGLTMAALLGATVLSIAQIGTTIAVGLLIDTLVIRTFVVPSIAVLLGRWFWWPAIPRTPPIHAATRRVRSLSLH